MSNSSWSVRSIYRKDKEKGRHVCDNDPHRRNFIWPVPKSTNFIETILLYGEIPQIVVYAKGEDEEELYIIDGWQRYTALGRFINDEFRLKRQGLDKLRRLEGKKFSQLDENLRERILNTMLRFIIVKARNEKEMTPLAEELIKKELFRRYNLGISPLKKEEVSKAQFHQNEIDIHFKQYFRQEATIYKSVRNIFLHKSKNMEILMQHVRQLLVLHNIPINRYIYERDDIINKYYNYLSYQISSQGNQEAIPLILENFSKNLSFLQTIKNQLDKEKISPSGLIYDCLYWALSICEKEKIRFSEFNNPTFLERLVEFITKRMANYAIEKSNYAHQTQKRYELVATFFSAQLGIDFTCRLKSDKEFLLTHKKQMNQFFLYEDTELEKQQQTRPLPTSVTIIDIIDRMQQAEFNIRPPYQRDESMNIQKASSLIESILLNIKLPAIYVYKHENGLMEVIDGQQRLLAILGYLGTKYRNENGDMEPSKKNNFSLDLKSGPFAQLHKKKFCDLPDNLKKRIYHFEINIIEITAGEYGNFKPEDMFKRLNYKPFPIKKNSFEFWNACIDSDVINSIKELHQRNNWLYLRKEDTRMLNEGLFICLCYLHYMNDTGTSNMTAIKEVLSIYSSRSGLNVKIKNKSHITEMLQDAAIREAFLLSLNSFETAFMEKVKLLTDNPASETKDSFRTKQLDIILQTEQIRIAASFYVLWLILKGIPTEFIREARSTVRSRINRVFSILKAGASPERFESAVIETWSIVD